MCNKLVISLIVILSTINACKKDNNSEIGEGLGLTKNTNDYRNKYLGTYKFEIINERYSYNQASTFDTIYYIGEVEKQDTSLRRVIIHYGKDTIGYLNSLAITEFPDPIIDSLGQLTHPEITGSSYGFWGRFINSDSLTMNHNWGGLGLGTRRKITGRKL